MFNFLNIRTMFRCILVCFKRKWDSFIILPCWAIKSAALWLTEKPSKMLKRKTITLSLNQHKLDSFNERTINHRFPIRKDLDVSTTKLNRYTDLVQWQSHDSLAQKNWETIAYTNKSWCLLIKLATCDKKVWKNVQKTEN